MWERVNEKPWEKKRKVRRKRVKKEKCHKIKDVYAYMEENKKCFL